MKHLGIVSDAHHYRDVHGRLCTLTPLARQFEQWATLFDRVTVLAPLLAGSPPSAFGPYASRNIDLQAVPLAGGNNLRGKLGLLPALQKWWREIRRLLGTVDAVHIRSPNNVGIPALLAVAGTRVFRQAAFTGTWPGYEDEPMTYKWQRWYLARRFAGPVAVYGQWPQQPSHIVPSFSPSFSESEWEVEHDIVSRKVARLRSFTTLLSPISLVTIGSLNKNQDVVIRVVKELADRGVEARLEVLGGGPQQENLENLVRLLGLERQVRLHGRVSHVVVRDHLRSADFAVQAPTVEGFGKVPIEAFLHGAIPILSDVNLSRQLVGEGMRGRCFPLGDQSSAATAVMDLRRCPGEMAHMVELGRIYSRDLTLERWRLHLKEMLEQHWKVRFCPNAEAL